MTLGLDTYVIIDEYAEYGRNNMSEEQDQRLINIFANEALRKDEELAELKVEIAKLREIEKNYVCPELYEVLIVKNEALRKDKERLDWMLSVQSIWESRDEIDEDMAENPTMGKTI